MNSWTTISEALPPENLFVLVHLVRVFKDRHDVVVAKRIAYVGHPTAFFWRDSHGLTHFGQYVDRWANIPDVPSPEQLARDRERAADNSA